jgi:hypothetical protein
MRSLILLLGLAASVASAQQPEPAPSSREAALTPPPLPSTPTAQDEPEWATPDAFSAPAPTEAPPPPAALPEAAQAPAAHPAATRLPARPESAPLPVARPEAAQTPVPTPREVEPAPTPAPARSQAPAPGAVRAPAPACIGPAEPASKRALRYSRLSAGEGGSLVVLTEAMGGLVTGAMLGGSYDGEGGRADGAYAGAMLGALTLGAAGTLYQYFVPVRRNESLLAAGAATLGFTAGVSAANAWDMDSRQRALLSLVTSQVGVASVLLLTSGGEDVSSGDTALMGMMSFYALLSTSLVEYIGARQSGERFRYAPVLIAPAAGMLLGGLLAIPLEVSPSSIRDITVFPLGMGALALLVGSRLDVSQATVAKTVAGTVGGTFALTVLLTVLSSDVPTQQDLRAEARSGPQAVPVPVVMPAGRDNRSLAAGPGLFMRF